MKSLTCKDLGGACNAIITGNTPEEMAENSKNHALEMMKEQDQAHMDAMQKMSQMNPEQLHAFMMDFMKKFEEAEEI